MGGGEGLQAPGHSPNESVLSIFRKKNFKTSQENTFASKIQ